MDDQPIFRPEDRHIRELPPRTIDWYTQATIVFGGFFQQFGWIFFGFGMIFFWVFGWNSEARYWLDSFGKWEETTGVIIMSDRTGASQNGATVMRLTFQYEVGGKRLIAKAYESGSGFEEGVEVPVLYKKSNPKKAYIKGARRAMFSGWALFVSIFPLVGLIFITVSIKSNLKFLDLLKIGEFTRGSLCAKEATGGYIKINNATYPIFKYEFEFEYKNKPYKATTQTHLAELVEDEKKEIILFDRFNPAYSVVYDTMPNAPDINPAGFMEVATWRQAWVFLVPGISILGHGSWLLSQIL